MSTPGNQKRILSVDDTPAIHLLMPAYLSKDGNVEILNSEGMDVAAAVNAIRLQLEGVDVLILDGNYEDPKKTKDQTALQVIQALAPELSTRGITVIVYSSDNRILAAVKAYYPSVSVVVKPMNFDLIKEAIASRVPFQANQAS